MGAMVTRILPLAVVRMYHRWFSYPEARILLWGLAGSGKTTILYQWKLGECVPTIPTIGFNVEGVVFKRLSMVFWDVGGAWKQRPSFCHAYQNTHAIVFAVDATASADELEAARDELYRLWNASVDHFQQDTVLLVMANKQDLPGACRASELAALLRLEDLYRSAPLRYIQECSATSGEGISEGLEWLHQAVTNATD